MLIRTATIADVPVMLSLEQNSPPAAHWSREQYDRIFNTAPPSRIALVIEEIGGMQGFLIAQAIAPDWEIENIVIAANARRRGLGTQLLRKLLDRARGERAEAVFLEVRESNRAARTFYEKWAFVESGRRVGYYQNPVEDAIAYRHSFP